MEKYRKFLADQSELIRDHLIETGQAYGFTEGLLNEIMVIQSAYEILTATEKCPAEMELV